MKTLYLEINDPDPAVDHWKPLSYIVDWREAFLADPSLQVELCNINNTAHYGTCLKNIGDYDLLAVSHAATDDDMTKLLATRTGFDGRKGKLAVFIGNEYDIMGEKIAFIRATGAEYICTQLPRAGSGMALPGLPRQHHSLPVGGTNLLNTFPDKQQKAANTSFGRFVYTRNVSQIDQNGGFYYLKAELTFF